MPDVHREVELKYAADETFEIPPLTEFMTDSGASPARGDVPLSDGVIGHDHLEAVYYDTTDLRLAAAGLTLRRRTGGGDAGWHLKIPAGVATRSEIRLPPGRVPPGRAPRAVPEQLQSMVWAQTWGQPLQPVARITTERTVRRLTDPTGQVLVEVADDRVTGQRLSRFQGLGDAVSAALHWREIEVELGDGVDPDLLDTVDSNLRQRGLERSTAPSKLAHLLAALPSGSPDKADKAGKGHKARAKAKAAPVSGKTPSGDVVLAHLREQVAQIQSQDLPVRMDAPDAIHKMRVATRRVRSALKTFEPLFDPDVTRPLGAELKWLASELGAARDAEVMRDRVRTTVAAETPASAVLAGADLALADLDRDYRTAHDRVLAELDSDRYRAILTTLRMLVEQPPLRKPANGAAKKVLPPRVARSYTRVNRFVDQATMLPAGVERDELLHDARKAAKQSRYAGESVSAVFGDDAKAYAAALEAVQEALGEHQDSLLTRERLHALALQATAPEVAFLYGRLHAQEESRAAALQHSFDTAWDAAGRKSLHRWLH